MDEETKKKTIEAYDAIADDFNFRNSETFYKKEADIFCSFLADKKNVLEIGCGTGRDAQMLISLGLEYTGVDASAGMLEKARNRLPDERFLKMDFFKLAFPDNSFDGFWAAASFLHVPKKDVGEVLQEAKRILKSGGIGYISLKQKTSFDEGMIHQNAFGGIDRYFAFYDHDEFKKIVEQNGFSVLKTMTETENDPASTVWICFFVQKQ